jgi:threonine dehydratase
VSGEHRAAIVDDPSLDPTVEDVRAAADRIRDCVHRTPVVRCASVDWISGTIMHFKCEHLQKAGAFKARGACNAVFSLDRGVAARGVTTHSSGNHGAALARAAALRGIPAHIVMPTSAPPVKRAAVEGYGARVIGCGPALKDRERTLGKVVEDTGAVFIHPYHDPRVIAGQGTAALEFCEEVPELEVVMAPVGGGGLFAGTAVAVSALAPGVELVGAEPELADDAFRSLARGELQPPLPPRTVADGLRTALSPRTFRLIRTHAAVILTCSEGAILEAMRLLWTRAKLLVEPSAAVPLAVVLEHPERFQGRHVGVILSGGNVDLDNLPWSLSQGPEDGKRTGPDGRDAA